jgi:AcrR family transcriptional regulator
VLISATTELLWDNGCAATSPAMIQKRAGVGQGSMYHHFSGKPALVSAAISRRADQLRREAQSALHGDGSAMERIHAYLDLQRDPLRGCMLGKLGQESDVLADEVNAGVISGYFSWIESEITVLLRSGVSGGQFRTGADVAGAATLLVCGIQGAYVLARSQRDPSVFHRAISGIKQAVGAILLESPQANPRAV